MAATITGVYNEQHFVRDNEQEYIVGTVALNYSVQRSPLAVMSCDCLS